MTDIFDFEVWVTPLTRYLRVKSIHSLPLNMDLPDADFYQSSSSSLAMIIHGNIYFFEMRTKGLDIIEQLEKRGHYVRLKETVQSEFGKSPWMSANNIKNGSGS